MDKQPTFVFVNRQKREILSIDHFSKIAPRIGESIINREGKVYEVVDVIHSSWWTNGQNSACQIDIVVKLKK